MSLTSVIEYSETLVSLKKLFTNYVTYNIQQWEEKSWNEWHITYFRD